jgi:hypothetical protein
MGNSTGDGDDVLAQELIEVYFDLEEPAERDALFDRLVALRSPVVDEFLAAMMDEDEDDYVRAAAAAELARRGSPAAVARLEADLADPEEPFFFDNALQTLVAVRGPAFYDTLRALWHDAERDDAERRQAMLGLEAADLARALGDFVMFVEAQHDVSDLPDDQLEVAIAAFVRHEHRAALPALRGLAERISKAEIDPDVRQDLSELVREGIDLLAA